MHLDTAGPETRPAGGSEDPSLAYRQLKPGPGRTAGEVTSHQRARIDRAVTEVVGERGYRGATVREIARVAGISTRAFYEHYSGKEECFLRTHRLLANRVLRQVQVRAESASSKERLRVTVDTILEGWDPGRRTTRFMLESPYGAGPTALKQLRFLCRSLGEEVGRCLGRSTEGKRAPSLLIGEGIVLGLAAGVRPAITGDKGMRWPERRQGLCRWALSCSGSAAVLRDLQASQRNTGRAGVGHRATVDEMDRPAPSNGDDLALLHSAIVKLAAAGDDRLIPRRICAAAGVSRRSFNTHFADVDSCLIAAARLRADLAIERALLAAEKEPRPGTKALRGLTELCNQLARDRALATLCFGDVLKSSTSLLQRDQMLADRIADLIQVEDGRPPAAERAPATVAGIGALLGLLRNEVEMGRDCSAPTTVPALAYLALSRRR